MKKAVAGRTKPKVQLMTPHEELYYTYQTLRELTPRMEKVDVMLGYLMGMATSHAHDLLSLQAEIEESPPPQNLKVRYGG
jgi:hypothetical protein